VNSKLAAVFAFLVLFNDVQVQAADVVTSASASEIQTKLKERFPDVKIDSVQPSQWHGLYEVVTPEELVYTSEDGEFLFTGQVIATKTKENLTNKRWNELNAIDFGALPFDQAIKTVKGKGSRKIAVFSDPFCPYCQELEQNLQSMNDVTIYTFLFPLEQIHPGATEVASHIWCTQNRSSSWTDWMVSHKTPAARACKSTPIESVAALGAKLRVNSTPTLFFQDGSRLTGALSADELQQGLTERMSLSSSKH